MTQANKAIHKKKNTTSASQKNSNHHQNTIISPTGTQKPEISSSTTQSESTPNTNQQQVQYQELKNRITALESRVGFLETQLLITQNASRRLGKRLSTISRNT